MAATPKLFFAALRGIDTRRTAASHWVGLRAPHGRLLFWRKRVSRKQRHVRFGQIPSSARTYPTGSFGLRRCGNATRCPHASVRYAHPSFIAHFRGGGRNHLLLSLLDTVSPLGCHTVLPLRRPEKGHRDLTSLSIVAVRAGWWVLKKSSLHPELRVGMRRQPRKRQVTIGFTDQQR